MPDPTAKNGISGQGVSGLPRVSNVTQVRGVTPVTSSREQGAAQRREFLPSSTDVQGLVRIVNQMHVNLDNALAQLRTLPMLGGIYLRDRALVANTNFTIAHGLKRAPAVMFVSPQTNFARFKVVSSDSTHVVVVADATTTVDVWLFPRPGV